MMDFQRKDAASPSNQSMNTPMVRAALSPFDGPTVVSENALGHAVTPINETAATATVAKKLFFFKDVPFARGAVDREIEGVMPRAG